MLRLPQPAATLLASTLSLSLLLLPGAARADLTLNAVGQPALLITLYHDGACQEPFKVGDAAADGADYGQDLQLEDDFCWAESVYTWTDAGFSSLSVQRPHDQPGVLQIHELGDCDHLVGKQTWYVRMGDMDPNCTSMGWVGNSLIYHAS